MDRRMSGARVHRAGLLHTVPALVGTFDAALGSAVPGIELTHIVDPSLLAGAIRGGVTPEIAARVAVHIGHLVEGGAGAVLVTCSSIGEAVDAAAPLFDVPVLRVDAPMAGEAARVARAAARSHGRAGRIAVLATLEATLGPTRRILSRAVVDDDVRVDARVVAGAIDARNRGDQAAHDELIREAVRHASSGADVVVLAQASMAGAIAAMEAGVPVLTSPESSIAALVRSLTETPPAHSGSAVS